MKNLKNLISILTSPQPSPLPSRERRGRTTATAWACWVCLVSLVTCLPISAAVPSTPFVSNLSQAGGGVSGVSALTGFHRKEFKTGANPEGYVLDSVRMKMEYMSGSGDLLVYLYSDNSDSLGTQLARLTGPDPSAPGTYQFTAPSGLTLSPSTKYWIAVTTVSNSTYYGWFLTTNAAQTFSASDGWIFLADQPTPDDPYVLEVNAWPVGRSSQYAQDFSSASLGATSFGDGSTLFSTDLGSVASVQDGTLKELQLTVNGSYNTRSAFLLPDLDPGQPIYAFSAKWNSQINGPFSSAGNGFSFNFGQLAGVDLISTALAQESGYTNGLSFSVQTSGGSPGFQLRVAGLIFASLPFNPATQWGVNNNTRHFFEVDWQYYHGLTVRLDGQTLFTNVMTYGFVPQAGDRFAWAARTAGSAEEVRLDNIVVVTGGNLVKVPISTPYYASAGSLEPQQAFDGDLSGTNNTWTDYSPPTGQIGGTLPARRNLNVYSITSGSTDRTSDPSQWILEGSTNAGVSWSGRGATNGYFLNPGETRCWLTANPESFNAVRLNIITNRGNSAVVRVGELTVYKLAPVVSPWYQTSLPSLPYGYSVASSADGSYLVAAGLDDQIYRSFTAGASWFQTLVGSNAWIAICSSADGNQMAGATYPGSLVTFGNFYHAPSQPTAYWSDIACSSDCNTLVAAGPYLYTSTDAGSSWNQRATLQSWTCVAASADGTKMAAGFDGGVNPGKMWTSSNSGVTWQETTSPSKRWKSVASSAYGTKLYASTLGETVYRSLDSGGTWSATSLSNGYYDLACSADGSVVVAAGDSSIFVSYDSGARWWNLGAPVPVSPWRSVALSADGARLVAGMSIGGVWTCNLFSLPSITDMAPSQITTTSATLNAQINAHGLQTSVFFSYGTSTNYGYTLATNLGNPDGYVLVQMPLMGLNPATTYHCRVGAQNAAGILTWGADQAFTTVGLPPVATTLAPTNVSTWSAELAGMASPVSVPTIAWFETGPTTSYGNRTAATPVATGTTSSRIVQKSSFTVSTTYHYRFVVSNELGMSFGADQSFTTPGDLSDIDVLTKECPVSGTSSNTPSGEEAQNAIDDTAATKYTNFDKLNAGIIVRAAGARVVRALSLISARDLPERDPASFLLEGSLDGTNFTAIASNAVPPFAGRSAIQSIAFTNTNAFTVYRLRFPTVVNPAAADAMQISEVELLAVPEISSSNDLVNVTATGAFWTPAQTLCNRLLDGTDKFAVQNNATNVVVDITPAAGPTVLTSFELVGGNDSYPERHPISLTVLGSNDGTNFVELGSFIPPRPTADMQIQEFPVSGNVAAFAHYRFNFGPQQSDIWWQLGEIRLFGEAPPTGPSLSIRVSGTNVQVSWPYIAGFNLETKTSLNDPDWLRVNIAGQLNNGVNTVTIPMSTTTGFFRLKK